MTLNTQIFKKGFNFMDIALHYRHALYTKEQIRDIGNYSDQISQEEYIPQMKVIWGLNYQNCLSS